MSVTLSDIEVALDKLLIAASNKDEFLVHKKVEFSDMVSDYGAMKYCEGAADENYAHCFFQE